MATSSSQSSLATPAVWKSWQPVWHSLFYSALVLATVVLLLVSSYAWWEYLLISGLTLLLACWYFGGMIVSPSIWEERTLITMGYLACGWFIWLWLIIPFPIYLFVLFGLYPQAFVLPQRPWNLVAGLLLTLVCLWRQFIEGQSILFFFSLAGGMAGLALAGFITAIARQSQQRYQLIRELETTRQELVRTERRAGVMEERQRLAREIHDTLAQGFTSIILHLEAPESRTSSDAVALQLRLDHVRRIAQESLADARRFMWALQPEAFDTASLADVLTDLARRWTKENEIVAQVAVTGVPCSLLPEIEVTLLRVAQEALVNIRRHARATQVMITLSYLDDIVALDVKDNGIGFDPSAIFAAHRRPTDGGFGLKALCERIEQWDGTCSIESTPGEGTTLAVSLPASENEAAVCLSIEEHVSL